MNQVRIFVTGGPGVGKSTLLRTIARALAEHRQVAGMFSGEIRVDGKRQGFQIQRISTGQTGVLASPHIPGEPRFGTLLPDGRRRLGIDLGFLEGTVCSGLMEDLRTAELLVLDEIGPMQSQSLLFQELVEEILDTKIPVLASIAQQDHPWVSLIRNRADIPVIEVTKQNRNLLTNIIMEFLCDLEK